MKLPKGNYKWDIEKLRESARKVLNTENKLKREEKKEQIINLIKEL